MSVSLTQANLQDIVADYMASGLTYAVADSDQKTRIDRIVASGERLFVSPPPIPGETQSHIWSFALSATADGPTYPVSGVYGETLRQACLAAAEQFLTRQAGEQFTKFIECLAASVWQDRHYQTPDSASSSLSMSLADVERVVCKYLDIGLNYSSLGTGAQERVNLIVRSGERWFLTPPPLEGEKTSHIWSFQSSAASTSVSYPVAGMYAEVLRQACLAAAEEDKNGKLGEQYKLYTECLAASVSYDRHFVTSDLSTGSVLTTVALADLQEIVSQFVNNIKYSGLPNGQKVRVDNIIRQGMRFFLSPPILKGEDRPHFWSFLGSSAPTTVTFPVSTQYAHTLVEACLAIAEMELHSSTEQADNTPRPDAAGQPGEHYRRFLNCLAASVWFDRYFAAPASTDSADTTGLDLTRNDLKRVVCDYLFDTLDYSALPAGQKLRVDDAIKSGERQFLSPPPVPGEKQSHLWSFLLPELDTPLSAGQDTYDMPSDYGGLEGPTLQIMSAGCAWGRCRETGIAKINELKTNADNTAIPTGQPTLFAVVPKRLGPGQPATSMQIVLWPTPDTEYSLVGPYYSNISSLGDADAYPFKPQHAETLKESCLAAAELAKTKERGAHYLAFMERLAASVSIDRQTETPKYFGKNVDRSIFRNDRNTVRHRPQRMTYNGADYPG